MAVAAAGVVRAGAQVSTSVDQVLDRVAERITQYYDRVQRLICDEKLTVQSIDHSYGNVGFGRVTEYELRVQPATGDADGNDTNGMQIARQLLRVNGKPPRERDSKSREGCTDANPLSPEPLAFLLPEHRAEYTFTLVGRGKGKEANTLIIEFTSPKKANKGELREDPRGHDGCYSWEVDASEKGRVWVDAATYEVVRVDARFNGMVDIRVPEKLQRKTPLLGNYVVVDRFETTIRYKNVVFTDPDETMLLPASIETVQLVRGGLQPSRRQQVFSNYRRFLTGGRIIK